MRIHVCPCCGSKLVVEDGDILTLEEAQDLEMDARIDRERERWGEAEDDDGG